MSVLNTADYDDELNESIEKYSIEDSVFIEENIKNLKECKNYYPVPDNKKILDDQWFMLLQKCIESPEFLKKLESLQKFSKNHLIESSIILKDDDGKEKNDNDDFEMISKDDVVESIANIIAAYVMECPETQDMDLKNLQKAMSKAFNEIKHSKLKNIWKRFELVSKVIATTCGAAQIFERPWLVKAIVMALWTMPRYVIKLIVFFV